jgi:hypothetical protein
LKKLYKSLKIITINASKKFNNNKKELKMKILTIYIVSIATGDFHNGDENDYTVAARSTREARRIAIEAMEENGMGKRQDIRKTFIQERDQIFTCN